MLVIAPFEYKLCRERPSNLNVNDKFSGLLTSNLGVIPCGIKRLVRLGIDGVYCKF